MTTMTIVTIVPTARALQPRIVALDQGSDFVNLDAKKLVRALIIEPSRDLTGSVATTRES
jgi:hypothetical protein